MSLEPIFMPTDRSRPTITVRPEPESAPQPAFRKSSQKATLGDQPNQALAVADFIDMINPLQHLPVVGDVYRSLTGDTISQEASILGGALFGGPIAMAAASVNALLKHESGGTLSEHVMAVASGEPLTPSAAEDTVALAAATAAKPLELAQTNYRPMITPPAVSPPVVTDAAERARAMNASYDPLDYNARLAPVAPATAPQPADALAPKSTLSPAEQQKHDTILELFGAGVSAAHDDYRKSQMIAHVLSAQESLIT